MEDKKKPYEAPKVVVEKVEPVHTKSSNKGDNGKHNGWEQGKGNEGKDHGKKK